MLLTCRYVEDMRVRAEDEARLLLLPLVAKKFRYLLDLCLASRSRASPSACRLLTAHEHRCLRNQMRRGREMRRRRCTTCMRGRGAGVRKDANHRANGTSTQKQRRTLHRNPYVPPTGRRRSTPAAPPIERAHARAHTGRAEVMFRGTTYEKKRKWRED